MTRLLTSGGALSCLLVVLAACDGGSSGGENGGGGGSGACAEYVNALVAYADRCGDVPVPALTNTRDRLQAACARALTAPGATNVAGQVSACARAISSATCGGMADADCELTGGTLEDGAACGESYQCKSGACKTEPSSSCGKCAPRAAIGEPCTGDGSYECVDGAECLSDSSSGGKCVAVKIAKAGEACSAPGEIVRCETGLECSFEGNTPVCTAPGGAGADCDSSGDCQSDLRCIANKCAAPLAAGAECKFDECGKGLGCSTEKKCAPYVAMKAGEACDLTRVCERGHCAGLQFGPGSEPGELAVVPGKCVDPLPDGAACTDDDEDDNAARCDIFAECIGGKCTPADPAQCK